MDVSVVAFILALVALIRGWGLPARLTELQEELAQRKAEQDKLQADLQRLRNQLAALREAGAAAPTGPAVAPVAAPASAPVPAGRPVAAPPAPVVPATAPPAVAPARVAPAPVVPVVPKPVPTELVAPVLPVVAPPVAVVPPIAAPPAATPVAVVPTAAPPPPPAPPRSIVPPAPPAPPRRPAPVLPPEPTGPTWWERASTLLLENWTGILGAVVLVTGVGFLGIYAALRMAPPYRFLLICAFSAGLLGARFALRAKPFARQLNAWLLSSAAAIFLFACVGAVSIAGLRWATPPFDYLLLLAGVSANLYLAWRSSRQDVATLHGVLSLVALAVLPPTGITLAAAAGVTAFSIAITYRQLWKYQLLLSIVSFFVFHLYWHRQLAVVSNGLKLTAMGLVLLVGVAAAVVQYRSVYAKRRFEPLLFAAHILNWTCLGINLYLYSTGSVWKTIPLALGALLTFWTGRQAKRLGIGWLFQTDTIISLILALATALSLQGWHATPLVIGLFMLLESLLVALIMARQREVLVYRVAMGGAVLAAIGLLLLGLANPAGVPLAALYRHAAVLALAGWAGLAFGQLIFKQPLLQATDDEPATAHRQLLSGFAGLAGLLQAGAGVLLAQALFGRVGPGLWAPDAPKTTVLLPLLALTALGGISLGLATWVRRWGQAPGWVRWQQLVLGQFFVVLAIFGLHELGLIWSAVFLVLFAENLLVLLLLAGRAEADTLHHWLYRAALAQGLLSGTLLLMITMSHLADPEHASYYRQVAVLVLGSCAGLAFVQFAFRLPLLQAVKPYFPRFIVENQAAAISNQQAHPEAVSAFAGLAGLMQAGAGILLERLVFDWPPAPVAGLLVALLGLAALALGLAAWVQAWALAPSWVRRQQLVLGQFLAVLAIFGLHQLGLSWPSVLLVLYAENLLVAAALSGRDEEALRHTQTYLLVAQALLLPLLVRHLSPLAALGPLGRAGLLLGAALLTLAYQARRLTGRFQQEEEFAGLPLGAGYRLPALGLAVGWLILGAASLEFRQPWAGWAVAGLLGALLVLRQRAAVPGLWAGLVLAGTGYMALQWSHVIHPLTSGVAVYSAGYVGLYLLPMLAVPVAGLLTSWYPAGERFVRAPWLYLLAAHLVVALASAVPAGHVAYLTLGLLALGSAAFAGALRWRRGLPDAAAVTRAGQPDRYLLHLSYLLLFSTLLTHLWLVARFETFFGLPAEYFTAALLFGVLTAVALTRPPITEPIYNSWRILHRWLPEAALLFGTLTLAHNLRAPWLPLLWVLAALVLSGLAGRLPAHFRRIGLYGRLYYWLAALTASADAVLYVSPGLIARPEWWALVAAVALLFGYVGLALGTGNAPYENLSLAWALLARPTRRQLEAALLYPAFGALSLLLYQSFDRSVLTVLLMLEVVAVFSTSLLLRRQDLRYIALAGMLGCLVRLVFFDLRQSNTVTRAIVFIFMGLLLLGMNALYARFKDRFAGPAALGQEGELANFDAEAETTEEPSATSPEE